MKYCADFDAELGKPQCCNSCHDDIDEYGSEYYCETDLPDGETFCGCCTVVSWLEGRQ